MITGLLSTPTVTGVGRGIPSLPPELTDRGPLPRPLWPRVQGPGEHVLSTPTHPRTPRWGARPVAGLPAPGRDLGARNPLRAHTRARDPARRLVSSCARPGSLPPSPPASLRLPAGQTLQRRSLEPAGVTIPNHQGPCRGSVGFAGDPRSLARWPLRCLFFFRPRVTSGSLESTGSTISGAESRRAPAHPSSPTPAAWPYGSIRGCGFRACAVRRLGGT